MSTTAITNEELLKIQDQDESALQSVLTKLQPIVEKNYKKYKYLPRDTYETLFKKGIVFYIRNTKVENIFDFYEYVQSKFSQIIDFQIGIAINSDKTIIFNFYEQLKKDHLLSLSRFFNRLHADLDIDFYVELIEKYPELSAKLQSMIGNTKVIKSDAIDKMSTNTYVEQFIRSYMLIKGIEEIYEDEEELDDDFDDKDQDESSKKTNGNQDFSDVPDVVKQYLLEIGTFPLLSFEEEREYFRRLKAGEEKYREIIINSNLRLAVSIAKRYIGRGLSFLDLIQEGNVGLMKAVDLFDVEKGYKFSTYATWWIRQAVTRAIGNDSRTVRLPVHVHEKVGAIKKAQRQFLSLNAREATNAELSAILDMPVETIAEYLAAANDPTSLSHPIGDDGESELEDFIPDDKLSVEDEAISSDFKKKVSELIETTNMNERLKEVIKYRFGFYGRVYTLEEVGAIFGVTRERIRQIEAKALRCLRRNRNTEHMTTYMDDPERAKRYLKAARSRTDDNSSHAQIPSFGAEPTLNHITGETKGKKKTAPTTHTKTGTQSLQEYLHVPYNKQEYLYDVIVAVDEKDMNLIVRQFGEDFKGLKSSNLNNEERNRLFVIVLPVLSKILDKLLTLSQDSMEYSNIIEKIPTMLNGSTWRAPTPEEAKEFKRQDKEAGITRAKKRDQSFNMLEYFEYAFKFEELMEAIKLLKDEEIRITTSVCGPKLDGQDITHVSKEERNNFGKYYLKKIKLRLAKLYPERAAVAKLPKNPNATGLTNDIPRSLKEGAAQGEETASTVETPALPNQAATQATAAANQDIKKPNESPSQGKLDEEQAARAEELSNKGASAQPVEPAPPVDQASASAPEEESPSKKDGNMPKKRTQSFNLIAYFNNVFTFDELMSAIKLLSDSDVIPIMSICGPALDGENTTDVDKKERSKFNTSYLPKIKKRLIKLYPDHAEIIKSPKKAEETATNEQGAPKAPSIEKNDKATIPRSAGNFVIAPVPGLQEEKDTGVANQTIKKPENTDGVFETFIPTFDLVGYFENKYTYSELRRVIATLTFEEKESTLKICGSKLNGQNTSEVEKYVYEKFIAECLPKIKTKAEIQQTTSLSDKQRKRIQRVVASSGLGIEPSSSAAPNGQPKKEEQPQHVEQPQQGEQPPAAPVQPAAEAPKEPVSETPTEVQVELEAAPKAEAPHQSTSELPQPKVPEVPVPEAVEEPAPKAPSALETNVGAPTDEPSSNPIEKRTGAKSAKKAEFAPAPGGKPFKIVPVPDLPQINIGLANPVGGTQPAEPPTQPKEPPITRRRPPVINIPSFDEPPREAEQRAPQEEPTNNNHHQPVNNAASIEDTSTPAGKQGTAKEEVVVPPSPSQTPFTLNDLKLIKEIINQPEFQTMIKMSFTIEEVLVALMLHYGFNGETFSIVEIANFLHADTEQIKDIARRSIGKYKELMNQKFDEYERHILSKIANQDK